MEKDALKKWRKSRNLTQTQVAELLGMSAPGYRRFESRPDVGMHPGNLARLKALMREEPAVYNGPPHLPGAPGTLLASLDPEIPAFCHALRIELHLLGDWMVPKELSGESKSRRFAHTIRGFAENLTDVTNALEKT